MLSRSAKGGLSQLIQHVPFNKGVGGGGGVDHLQ